ncbi:MAG: cytochrome c3 family protein [Bacillota bacterium]|nr:cytochrome c3 family protein [Bacillota bacterium]
MKRPLFMALLALALVALVGAGALAATIVNSKHDLSSTSTNGGIKSTNETQICIFCHTPHQPSGATTKPLWNHTTTTSTFTMYSNTTIQGAVDPQPSGGSELCLSCHDGSVAINSILNASTVGTPTLTDPRPTSHLTADNKLINSSALLDNNLSNDHPVSITYDSTNDKGLRAPTGNNVVNGSITLPLFSNKVQCGSCHNVHDPSNTPFLRASNDGSALCLTCHLK